MNKDISCCEIHKKCDIYSYAISMFEIISASRAWSDTQKKNLSLFVTTGIRPTFKEQIFNDKVLGPMANLVIKCWAQDTDSRPTSKQVIEILETIN